MPIQLPPSTDQPPGPGVRDGLLRAAVDELVEHGSAGISLRAVARRAGVSHAAPKHHFGDRAGLLTAVATQGFHDLTTALHQASAGRPADELSALGLAYVDFGLAHPALFDLMFRTVELDEADAGLQQAQADAIAPLARAADVVGSAAAAPPATLTVLAWALVHGLVVLVRDGALQDPGQPGDRRAATALAHHVVATLGRLVRP